MTHKALPATVLFLAYAAGSGCGGFGSVNQGQVVQFDKEHGLITLIQDSNYLDPDRPRFDVLPAVTIGIPADRHEMGPEPEPGKLLRVDWANRTAVIYDAASRDFKHIPYTIVEQRDNIARDDQAVAGRSFPAVDRAARTITIHSVRDRKWAVISVAAEYLPLPEDTWKFGDEVRYYYKNPRRALRLMNVTRTDLSTKGK